MSIRTLSQKIETLRNCLPCEVKKKDRLKASNGGELVFHDQQKNKNYQNNKKLFPPSTNHKENGFSKEAQQNVQRNLIRVLRLDDDFVDCHFGDGKCVTFAFTA